MTCNHRNGRLWCHLPAGHPDVHEAPARGGVTCWGSREATWTDSWLTPTERKAVTA